MRRLRDWAAALVLACMAVSAAAGEMELRKAVEDEIQAAFQRGDYKAIEARYAKALASSERTPSGLFVSTVVRLSVVPFPVGSSTVPGRDDHWLPVERKLDTWAAQFPDSALVAVAQSSALLGHGWSWRGNGYARSVTAEGFAKFAAYGKRAHEALVARETAGRKDPHWHAQRIKIAGEQGWAGERYMAAANDATKAFPQYHEIYFEIARKMVPRWGGSTEAIANLSAFAVDQTRATEGEALYARIHWAVEDWLDAELSGPDVDWKRIRAGFEDIVKRYPDPWNLNNYARMACEARDTDTARRVLLRIKDDVVSDAWPDRPAYLRCLQAAGVKREGTR